MLRIFAPIIFFAVFIVWILYRLLVKKGLKQNLAGLYVGLTFTAVWAVIYYLLLK